MKCFTNLYKITQDVKLRNFQYSKVWLFIWEELLHINALNWSLHNIILNTVHPDAKHAANLVVLIVKSLIFSLKCQGKCITIGNVITKEHL